MSKQLFPVAMAWFLLIGVCGMVTQADSAFASQYSVTFDKIQPGSLPDGWKSDATNKRGKPHPWKVVKDAKAASGANVLALPGPVSSSGSAFNICWTPSPAFKDGTIQVKVRADSGREDQGGGPIWRVQDSSNYYVARYNPLEKNLRIYRVKGGWRRMLESAEDLDVKAGEWFTIKIVQNGDKIQGWLNGKKLLELRDRTFLKPGGVGVWTKADAATSFDSFVVEPSGAK